jgi:hypothetical protein
MKLGISPQAVHDFMLIRQVLMNKLSAAAAVKAIVKAIQN